MARPIPRSFHASLHRAGLLRPHVVRLCRLRMSCPGAPAGFASGGAGLRPCRPGAVCRQDARPEETTHAPHPPRGLCAAKGFTANTPPELVAHAKRNPGTTFAGTSGVVRLAPLLFAQLTELDLTYIPYRGSTAAHPDLISGRVDIMFDTVPAA